MNPAQRCGIYTRKSTEEGLEQGFNSLHAQRGACEAYVLSQVGEGWSALPTAYDDGGFSGGSMERPGLQALMADIRRGLIDVVVVYKVDRLTRSLADFARLVELFDEQKVSFVSVTQAFNTTTSMGRLTLNVLLSFAQFEREVTGERIRDKIAASKAKGMWMGGRPPLGYDAVGRKLVVNAGEAETIRHIFQRYLELDSVLVLAADLKARGITSKRWTNRQGQLVGGATFTRGAIYHLLANPVYRGGIRHKERLYEHAHPAIVEEDLWLAVQAKLAANGPDHPSSPLQPAEALLRGLIFDDRGEVMRPLHTKKGAKRYRYYASAPLYRDEKGPRASLPRIAMGVIERFVVEQATPLLSRGWRSDQPIETRVREALVRVTIGEDRVVMLVRKEAAAAKPHFTQGDFRRTDDGLELAISIRLKHRHGAVVIEAPNEHGSPAQLDRALIRGVCLARNWARKLAAGKVPSILALARQCGFCNHYAAKLMPLAWLAPDLVEAILEGRQPPALTLGALLKHTLPTDWNEQRRLFAAVG